MLHRLIPAALVIALCGCTGGTAPDSAQANNGAADAPELATDEQRTLYALGVALSSNIEIFNLTAEEIEIVNLGMRDTVLGEPERVDMDIYGARIQQLAAERSSAAAGAEKELSAAFAAQMAQEPGAEVFDSGLIVVPMTEGTGENPTPSDTVRVHYHGTLRDGTVFDSSVDRGESIAFPLSGVIPCWTEGVQKIRVGGKAKLVCPADIAYGDSGTGPIPGGATLLFEVELLGIE